MKFIHCADIHLDSVFSGVRSFYGTQKLNLSEHIQSSFQRLIDLALTESVDFIVIAGDLFDRDWKDYQQGLFFLEQIKRFTKPIYYISGNHDAENRLLKRLPFPNHVYKFCSSEAQTYYLEECKAALHGRSYPTAQVDYDLTETYPSSKPGYFNIGLLHTSGEVNASIKSYSPVKIETLVKKGYNYWALGHVHSFQFLNSEPPIVYSGVLQGRHIKEEGNKGCCIVEVDENKKTKVQFCSLSSLIYKRVDLPLDQINTESELKELLIRQLKKFNQAEHSKYQYVLRLRFTGVCHLKILPSENIDHYEHAIFCWLQEFGADQFFLEKVENESLNHLSEKELYNKYKDLETFFKEMSEMAHNADSRAHLVKQVDQLKKQLPHDLKIHPMFTLFTEEERLESLTNQAHTKLLNHLKKSLL